MNRKVTGLMALGAMLSCTLIAQGVPQIERKNLNISATPDLAPGQSPNSGSIDDDCTSGGFALGTLSPFMSIQADTNGLANDFGCDAGCPAPCGGGCGFYTIGAADGVATFEVPVSGAWRFATCGGVAYDTSLAVRSGGACPGTSCVGQDDDSCAGCNAPYEARLTVNLTAGTTYYLIVDGYSGAGNADMLITGPCGAAGDCQDGVFCNGAEVCTAGMCAAGANPCTGNTPFCDEANDVCFGCNNNADCEDGIFCNGSSTCNAGTCSPQSGNPCTALQTCDEANDVCVNPDPCITWLQGGLLTGGSFSVQRSNGCADQGQGDDIELSLHGGRKLNYYQTQSLSRAFAGGACPNGDPVCDPAPLGSPYTAVLELRESNGGGDCLPGAVIPGSTCIKTTNILGNPLQAQPGGTPIDEIRCDALGGLGSVTIPDADDDPITGQCGVDVYMIVTYTGVGKNGAGWSIAIQEQTIGGPAMDDEFLQSVFVAPGCDLNGDWDATWGFAAFPVGFISDFRRTTFCTEPVGACCDGMGGCSVVTEDDCTSGGGTYLGDSALGAPNGCSDGDDTDGDDTRDECDLCPMDANKTAPGECGCGVADTDTDSDGTADCNDGCPMDPGKTDPGVCGCGNPDTDTDGDGTPDCQDGCPDDANKTDPGVCGCGVAETGDSDGDGVQDCIDQCPGVDDSVFAPGCVGAIPTVSEWGMVVLALLLLAGAKVYFGRRPVQA